jgi:hypothetical protein
MEMSLFLLRDFKGNAKRRATMVQQAVAPQAFEAERSPS